MYRRMSNSTSGQNMGQQSSPMPMQNSPLHMQRALEQQQSQQSMQQQATQPQETQIPPVASSLEQLIAEGPPMQSPSTKFTDASQTQQFDKINKGMPITGDTLQYLNGFLRTQIGRRVHVEFLIGTNTLTDKQGILLGVGINYILLNETDTDDITACDFYNIKFITFNY